MVYTLAMHFRLSEYLSFQVLKSHRTELLLYNQQYPLATLLIYILLYVAVVAFSIPGATLITLAGGFLFLQPFSLLYTLIGAVSGAMLIFCAARLAFGNLLKRKVGGFLQKMESGIREEGAYYLLFLRLVSIFPFWVVNLVPAFLGVSAWTFFGTTGLGIIPGAFVFKRVGAGLGAVLDRHRSRHFIS